jgi:aspartyl aminopeptidase
MPITSEDRAHAQDLLNFIDASPSPWHAVDTITKRFQAQGFVHLQECIADRFQDRAAAFT